LQRSEAPQGSWFEFRVMELGLSAAAVGGSRMGLGGRFYGGFILPPPASICTSNTTTPSPKYHQQQQSLNISVVDEYHRQMEGKRSYSVVFP
jgi:hypothetical protein